MKKLTITYLFLLVTTFCFGQKVVSVTNTTECSIVRVEMFSVGPCGLVEIRLEQILEPLQTLKYTHINGYEMWIKSDHVESFCSKSLPEDTAMPMMHEQDGYRIYHPDWVPSIIHLTGDPQP